jgi:predicted ester cyclase
MSEENIAIVRRLTEEGFVGGKVGVVDDVVADGCIDHDPLPGQSQGREGQRQTCGMVVTGLSARSALQDDFLAVGDRVIESWIFQGTHTGEFMGVPATGRQIQVRGMEIWRLADGKIVERWGVIDSGAVMAQMIDTTGRGRQ